MFHELTQEQIQQIARMLLGKVAQRLAERGIRLESDDSAVELLAQSGFDPQYGARPLRRAIQRMVEDALSEEILSGHIQLGSQVQASAQEGKLVFTPVQTPAPQPTETPVAN